MPRWNTRRQTMLINKQDVEHAAAVCCATEKTYSPSANPGQLHHQKFHRCRIAKWLKTQVFQKAYCSTLYRELFCSCMYRFTEANNSIMKLLSSGLFHSHREGYLVLSKWNRTAGVPAPEPSLEEPLRWLTGMSGSCSVRMRLTLTFRISMRGKHHRDQTG